MKFLLSIPVSIARKAWRWESDEFDAAFQEHSRGQKQTCRGIVLN